MEYQICSTCVMDTTDPDIAFDINGVCDHCTDFFNNVKHCCPVKNPRLTTGSHRTSLKGYYYC